MEFFRKSGKSFKQEFWCTKYSFANDAPEFLKLRFRMLEAIESVDNINTSTVSKHTREHTAKRDVYKSTSLSATGELKFYVCKLSHTIYKCPVFLNLSIFDRICVKFVYVPITGKNVKVVIVLNELVLTTGCCT